ncbi:hypothetical protein DSM07_10365 [Oenococcus sp. UCMA 16435]|nr:hypothetical protein [Oenococcus sp. UCMA 14587]QHW12470.1 hypothetical protein DSM07_10365 [Oenococcus sp. UCMA 16435]
MSLTSLLKKDGYKLYIDRLDDPNFGTVSRPKTLKQYRTELINASL